MRPLPPFTAGLAGPETCRSALRYTGRSTSSPDLRHLESGSLSRLSKTLTCSWVKGGSASSTLTTILGGSVRAETLAVIALRSDADEARAAGSCLLPALLTSERVSDNAASRRRSPKASCATRRFSRGLVLIVSAACDRASSRFARSNVLLVSTPSPSPRSASRSLPRLTAPWSLSGAWSRKCCQSARADVVYPTGRVVTTTRAARWPGANASSAMATASCAVPRSSRAVGQNDEIRQGRAIELFGRDARAGERLLAKRLVEPCAAGHGRSDRCQLNGQHRPAVCGVALGGQRHQGRLA